MVFLKDARELRFVRFNRAGEALLGTPREKLLGKNDFDFFPKDQAEFFQAKDRAALARPGEVVDIPEEPIETPAGRRFLHTRKTPLLGPDGKVAFLLGISEDVTERKALADELASAQRSMEEQVDERTAALRRANEALRNQMARREVMESALRAKEEQLRQAQKMEAVGQLAGGVAHDFNNLLSVILSYSQSLQREITDVAQRADLLEIEKAGHRAAGLTRQLLAFSRRQVLEPRVVDLNEVLAGTEKMLARLIREDIELKVIKGERLGLVRVDPGQIEQVILNLVVNARDAMEGGGRLTLETAGVDLDQSYAEQHLGVSPGPHVMLAVSDTGSGMTSEVKARIFEPFFTTKGPGQGTGLGLSTVFGIVQQSGGHVWVYSEPGRGTTFKIYFPRSQQPAPAAAADEATVALRGSETILLCEDEAALRPLVKRVLGGMGYRVLEAKTPAEAMELAAKHRGEVKLLLTDVVMPQMSGVDLARQLTSVQPDLAVLFMSGYAENAVIHHGVLEEGVNFLAKPIVPDALARKVREVLDGAWKRKG